MGKEVVIIGAVAYRIWIDDPYRHTEDVDVAVAIDLDDLPRLAMLLRGEGWKQTTGENIDGIPPNTLGSISFRPDRHCAANSILIGQRRG